MMKNFIILFLAASLGISAYFNFNRAYLDELRGDDTIDHNAENIIPVAPYSFDDISDLRFADIFVSAVGTWMSDSDLAYPIQASNIVCFKDGMRCVEAIGYIVPEQGHLIVDALVFDIERWNEQEIVTKPDDPETSCISYIMRLDRIQKQVTATKITTDDADKCESVDDKSVHTYLGDGLQAGLKNRNAHYEN